MKLTGELKKKVEKAETREAARETIANAGMLLNDDELDQVGGGLVGGGNPQIIHQYFFCNDCQKEFDIGNLYFDSSSGVPCRYCQGENTNRVQKAPNYPFT